MYINFCYGKDHRKSLFYSVRKRSFFMATVFNNMPQSVARVFFELLTRRLVLLFSCLRSRELQCQRFLCLGLTFCMYANFMIFKKQECDLNFNERINLFNFFVICNILLFINLVCLLVWFPCINVS